MYDSRDISNVLPLLPDSPTMDTGRSAIFLAGIFAAVCLSSSALATPPSGARAQAAHAASQNNCPNVADIEAALQRQKEIEEGLQSRIHDLEEMQGKLIALITQPELEAPRHLEPTPSPGASPNWMLGGAVVFTLALCVVLLLRVRKPEVVYESRAREAPTVLFDPAPPPPSDNPAPPVAEAEAETEPPPVHPDVPALPEWDPASPALDFQSLKALVAKENIRRHDSAIELAEIMLSFGRINSAAEALSNFIESNPKEAFAPWIKLLDVYRTHGQRAEFDRIAQKLNRTFNVWTVNWDNFRDTLAPARGLESMTRIVERLRELWGTRECQAYLQSLLRDTRDETRQGFPLAAIDDILCLNDILEQRLGPYIEPNAAFRNGALDTAPPTETETEGDVPDSALRQDWANQENPL